MLFSSVIKLFKKGNVCVAGMRGSGKDLIIGNVIMRRKLPYISNLNYGGQYNPLNLKEFDIKNKYDNFINNNIQYWEFKYSYNTDLYISDVGVYYPSQYCNKLNNQYEGFAYYQALSRQVSHNNVHINVQNLNRAWDKIREQSDTYIRCIWCKVILGIVFQKIVIYDKYDSCLNRINPCRIKKPNIFMTPEARLQRELYLDNFYNQHGVVKPAFLIYKNKSNHDTYYFEKLLKKGKKQDIKS